MICLCICVVNTSCIVRAVDFTAVIICHFMSSFELKPPSCFQSTEFSLPKPLPAVCVSLLIFHCAVFREETAATNVKEL